ncbi:hypothetical protein [Ciceribacter sp. RN22]|uniref:hypothetical protein n=1 Tax=Ciceribacter sp. RN22 TaxID=2954932 RepID=UPI0020939475|nr:hypothetical protein [Ciceribacter sp. RN22]MCO6180269.1 hypothetical protein [Ciceribacter sp. RN22]
MTLTIAERVVIRILSAAGRIYGDLPIERAEEASAFHRALNAVIAVIEARPVHRATASLQPNLKTIPGSARSVKRKSPTTAATVSGSGSTKSPERISA